MLKPFTSSSVKSSVISFIALNQTIASKTIALPNTPTFSQSQSVDVGGLMIWSMPFLTVSYARMTTMITATSNTRLISLANTSGKRSVGSLLMKDEPKNTNNWFAVSPILCINSANMATFPVIKKAMPFMAATIALTIQAHKDEMLPFFNNLKISFMTYSFVSVI